MASQVIIANMQQIRESNKFWENSEYILSPGQLGFALDTYDFKIGDGIHTWTELPYPNYSEINRVLTLLDIQKNELISYIDSEIDNLSNELQTTRDSLNLKIDTLENTLNTKIDNLETDIYNSLNIISNDLLNLKTDYNTFKVAIDNKINNNITNLKNYVNNNFVSNTDLNNKVNTLGFVYKSYVDSALSLKADKTEIPDVTPFATKVEMVTQLNTKVDKITGMGLSQESFTTIEKNKLSSLESSHFKGEYPTLTDLEVILGTPGDYAYVDTGVNQDITTYIWDSTDNKWIDQKGSTTTETPATIKSKYESNPDTNVFNDFEKNKLAGLSLETATTIKTKYESNANTNAFTDLEKSKLSSITNNAQPNQNAFSNVKINSYSISASTPTDTVTIIAGDGIDITPNTTDKTITITATGNDSGGASYYSTVPLGAIMMWSGPISTIPTGWTLCDGTKGTPNLLNKFICGVSSSTTDPGDTGGSNSITLSINNLPSHNHEIENSSISGNAFLKDITTNINSNMGTGSVSTSVLRKEDFIYGDFNELTSKTTGSGTSFDNRPSYYALAYIMKIDNSGDLGQSIDTIETKVVVLEYKIEQVFIPIASIILNPSSANVFIGETLTIIPTIMPIDCSDRTVIWTTSDSSIATVDSNGFVTTLKTGYVVITCTARDGYGIYATCNITVNPRLVTSITLDKTNINMNKGMNSQITATVLPNNATDKSVTWWSDNTTIATVDQNGLVTAVGGGSCTITCSANDGSGISATCNVTVTVIVTGITISPTSKVIDKGNTFYVVGTITPNDATNKTITYSSSNTSIATVNSSTGLVNGVGIGSCTITATASNGGYQANCSLTVNDPIINVSGITISPTSKTVAPGDSFYVTGTVTPYNANNKTVTYSTSNGSIAVVNSSGFVLTQSVGSCYITAKSHNGLTANCSVTVKLDTSKFYNFTIQTGGIPGTMMDLGHWIYLPVGAYWYYNDGSSNPPKYPSASTIPDLTTALSYCDLQISLVASGAVSATYHSVDQNTQYYIVTAKSLGSATVTAKLLRKSTGAVVAQQSPITWTVTNQ